MKSSVCNALLGLALLADSGLAHVAVLPPFPERRLTPNSSEAPAGCKYLPSDKGFPAPKVWKAAFPDVFKKLNGTFGPDYMLQPQTIAEVQKAVNFAREHNVRFAIVSTGHDFGGRSEARSGLRIDMNSFQEPTVFSNTWTCGKKLKARSLDDQEYHGEIVACKVSKNKQSMTVPLRDNTFRFFQKREGWDCDQYLSHHKRQVSGGHDPNEMMMDGEMMMGGMGGEMPAFNTIKVTGDHAYARVAGGMYNEEFFTQAAKSDLMTLGAQHNGVSVVGGWLQFGGHNPFANRYGLAVDNVVEFEVVLADGKFVKASECENPDLYWALRGGGGSTFGVVTAITTKVFPTFPVAVSRFFINGTHEGIMKASAHFLQRGAELRDKYGLQGYFYIYPKSFQSVLHMPDKFATKENAKKVTELLMGEMEKMAGTSMHTDPNYYFYKTYKDWYVGEMGDEMGEENGVPFLSHNDGSGDDGSIPSLDGAMVNPISIIPWYLDNPSYPEKRSLRALQSRDPEKRAAAAKKVMASQPIPRHYLDSRLLSDEHVNSVSLDVLTKAVSDTMPNIDGAHYRGFLYGGGEWAKKDPASTGLHPAWRNATYHFIINAVPGSSRRDYTIGPIAKLFPDAGAYVNEASPLEPDWKQVFWGAHYPRLQQIKDKYDPEHLFWCSPCVGADFYTYDDERMCKNPNYPEKRGVPPPDTYPNKNSKVGITALPGVMGIENPLLDVVSTWAMNGTLPKKMLKSNYFKIAMGEGGSAKGKYADWDPYNPGQKLKPENWETN